MSMPIPNEKNPSGSPLPIGLSTIAARGGSNGWPFALTYRALPRRAGAKQLSVRDEGQEEQRERQQQRDQALLDQGVPYGCGESPARGHHEVRRQ
jgi:hypothetical protein